MTIFGSTGPVISTRRSSSAGGRSATRQSPSRMRGGVGAEVGQLAGVEARPGAHPARGQPCLAARFEAAVQLGQEGQRRPGSASASCPGTVRVSSTPSGRLVLQHGRHGPPPCDGPTWVVDAPSASARYLTNKCFNAYALSLAYMNASAQWPNPVPRRPASPTRATGSSRCGPSARSRGWARCPARPRRCSSASRPVTLQLQALERELGIRLFERMRPAPDPDPRGRRAVRAGAAAGRRHRRPRRGLPRAVAGPGRGRAPRRRRQLRPSCTCCRGSSRPSAPAHPDVRAARCTTSPARTAWPCCASTRSTWRSARCSTCPPT